MIFEVRMEILGEEIERETQGVTRTERESLARFDVPVERSTAWLMYQEALHRAVAPSAVIKFPDAMSAEEAERFRAEWKKEHKS